MRGQHLGVFQTSSVAASGDCCIRPHTATPGASPPPWYVRKVRTKALNVRSPNQHMPVSHAHGTSMSSVAAFCYAILSLDARPTSSFAAPSLRAHAAYLAAYSNREATRHPSSETGKQERRARVLTSVAPALLPCRHWSPRPTPSASCHIVLLRLLCSSPALVSLVYWEPVATRLAVRSPCARSAPKHSPACASNTTSLALLQLSQTDAAVRGRVIPVHRLRRLPAAPRLAVWHAQTREHARIGRAHCVAHLALVLHSGHAPRHSPPITSLRVHNGLVSPGREALPIVVNLVSECVSERPPVMLTFFVDVWREEAERAEPARIGRPR